MTKIVARRPKRAPTHPGALLREDVLPAANISVSAAARALGVSRQTLHSLLREQTVVTPAMAVRLAALFGTSPDLWLGMQGAHDLWHAQRALTNEVRKISANRVSAAAAA